MKAKIDEYGNLIVEKNNKYISQLCYNKLETIRCGTWCPLFRIEREKEWSPEKFRWVQSKKGKKVIIILCGCERVEYELVEEEK